MVARKPNILFDRDGHRCLVFSDLVTGDGVQANQFVIIDNEHGAVLDPGGELTYTPLTIEMMKYMDLAKLELVLASHQDPDIIASLPRWLLNTKCKVGCSSLWSRFLPHLASQFQTGRMNESILQRMISIPDEGTRLPLGKSEIHVLPAHFLHSVGNFQFYDPTAKILFSGDMGASMCHDDESVPVDNFEAHIPNMQGFHQRYMCSKKVNRLWAKMVSKMDVEMLVPQHGKAFVGKPMINKFLNWVANLDCGVDLMSEQNYRPPV